jgi:NAD(P)-dependent dehydrogenase (short-subunit alcohol dehydrogenase family)
VTGPAGGAGRVLVAGALGGIGGACVELLARTGQRVVGVDRAAGGGSFVAIGSVLADAADRDFMTAAYAASKGGLASLTRTAAMEVAAKGIRVNLVAAGLADTPMASRALRDERIAGRLPELQPLGGRAVTAVEVAAAVAWLLSPASGRTTGTVLPVDGGWLLR